MLKAADKGLSWGVLDAAIGPRVRLLRNILTSRSIMVSAPVGLPTGSLTVLSLIAANPGSSQTVLARQAGINKSALVGLVDELEKRGLAERDRSTTDRRLNRLTVTKAGAATIEDLLARVEWVEAPVREALGEADIQQLNALLDRVLDSLKDEDASGSNSGTLGGGP